MPRAPRPTLIIGTTAEARALARALGDAARRSPEPDAGALVDVGAVIDATHPFGAEAARAIAGQARKAGLPHLQLVRPPWRATRRDRWTELAPKGLRHAIPRGARVIVTTGREELDALKPLAAQVFLRRTGPVDAPFPLRRGRYLSGQGPFTVAQEIALFRRLRADWLVTRNAGGAGAWPKLAAARVLGLRVALIRRPARPPGPRVTTVEEALTWLSRTL